jgi:5-enolpyruvylshikimate-3-phosphate synthase
VTGPRQDSSPSAEMIVRDQLVSVPYVDLTLDIMAQFAVNVSHTNYQRFEIPGRQVYQARSYNIEGDASSATYFLGLAALLGQDMSITNVPPNYHKILTICTKQDAFSQRNPNQTCARAMRGFKSEHAGGVQMALAAGSVRFINESND